MVKIIGIVITMLTSAFWGVRKYNSLKERCSALSQIKLAVVQLESRLRCMCMPLDECFNQSEGLFCEAAKYMETGLAPKDAIEKACAKNPYLSRSDKEVILSFAKGLSAEDCDGQIANATLFGKNIELQIENARSEFKSKGKLSIQGSILTATAVVLLLI